MDKLVGEYRKVSHSRKEIFLKTSVFDRTHKQSLKMRANVFADQVGNRAFGTVFEGVISNNFKTQVVAVKTLG